MLKHHFHQHSINIKSHSLLLFFLFLSLLIINGCSTQRTINVPAHAISYQHDSSNFVVENRGLNWGNAGSSASVTVAKPSDYNGGPITFRIFFQAVYDEPGTVQFIVTPVAFNSGNSFETYGSFAAPELAVPGDPSLLFEQSIQITSGNGWNETSDWWYLGINRQGSLAGNIRVMGIALDYN